MGRDSRSAAGPGSHVAPLRRDVIPTPLGPFFLYVDAPGRLVAAGWYNDRDPLGDLNHQFGTSGFSLTDQADPAGISAKLAAYFAGDLKAIDGIAVAAVGTDFQQAVWAALRRIPCGTTTSYGALARDLGRPAAVRAVGAANGANPIALVVPCHRVIGANGQLTGYASGLERKSWLLAHEKARTTPPAPPSGQLRFDL